MNVCRACLGDCSILVNIFTPLDQTHGEKTEQSRSMADVLNEIAGCELVDTSDHELPEYICIPCIDKAKAALEFKQLIMETHQNLLDKLKSKTFIEAAEIKMEPDLAVDFMEICDMIDNEDIKLIQDFQIKNYDPPESKTVLPEIKHIYNTRKKILNYKHLIDINTKTKQTMVKTNQKKVMRENSQKMYVPDETISFKCRVCKLHLSSKGNLKVHMLTHTGERPFHCPYCPKRFRQKQSLIVHIRIHTRERPVKCKRCSKTFRQQSNLEAHMARYH